MGIPDKRWQIEQNYVMRGIGKSWVGFDFSAFSTKAQLDLSVSKNVAKISELLGYS